MDTNNSYLNTHKEQLVQHNSQEELCEENDIIEILTYNLFLRPPLIKNNEDDMKNERVKLFQSVMGDFDVICLQEVFSFLNQRKHKLIYNSMKLGFYHHAQSKDPTFLDGTLVDGGLLTLSKKPIVYKEFKEYQYGVLSDNIALKGILYTKILQKESDGGQNHYLHLFNTHLQASYVGKEQNVKATVVTRVNQFLTLRQFVQDKLKEQKYEQQNDICLICGDFNVDGLNGEYPIKFLEQSNYSYLIDKLGFKNMKTFKEYDLMFGIISNFQEHKILDTLRQSNNMEYQITFADVKRDHNNNIIKDDQGKEIPREILLTDKDDLCSKQSLDYILHYTPYYNNNKNKNIQSSLQFVQGSSKTQPFFTNSYYPKQNLTVTQMSDHYGVSAQIQYNGEQGNQNEPIGVIDSHRVQQQQQIDNNQNIDSKKQN